MLIEKQKIKDCFNKAAATYDQAALLQHEVGKKLLTQLATLPKPNYILDVGAGTGYCTHLLAQQYPQAQIIGLDFAAKMIETAQVKAKTNEHYLCADFDNLPLMAETMDLVYTNFSLQWSLDLTQTLSAIKAVLKDQGYLIFSTLGSKTLYELRTLSESIDQQQHANEFLTAAIIKQHLSQQFNILELKQETKVLYFDDIFQLMHNLKEVGANHVFNKAQNGLAQKQYFQELQQGYERYRTQNQLPATYEIIYGVVQK